MFNQTFKTNFPKFQASQLQSSNFVIQRTLSVNLVQYTFGKVKLRRFKCISTNVVSSTTILLVSEFWKQIRVLKVYPFKLHNNTNNRGLTSKPKQEKSNLWRDPSVLQSAKEMKDNRQNMVERCSDHALIAQQQELKRMSTENKSKAMRVTDNVKRRAFYTRARLLPVNYW